MIFLEVEKNETAVVESFRAAIVEWFAKEGKSYPWRETRDPYAILVSELMLQQTRIATVLERGYFQRWMRKFPSWRELAEAPIDEVLKIWEGLGYYNRARNLQRAAQRVVEQHGGECPSNLEGILALPGVGRYTAGAVASFAFGMRAPILDGNVIRVLSRITALTEPVDQGKVQTRLWDLADLLAPETGIREFNSGLMELGQRVCHRKNPTCEDCPVRNFCRAFELGLVEEIPRKTKKTRISHLVEYAGLHVKNGKIFLCCETGARRKGLWRLPELDSALAADLEEVFRFSYTITRYKVDLRVLRVENSFPVASLTNLSEGEISWFSLSNRDSWPALASPYRKAILKFLEISDELL